MMLLAAEEAQNWMTWGHLGTFAGATLAVVVVANVAHRFMGRTTLWVPLVLCALITIVAAVSEEAPKTEDGKPATTSAAPLSQRIVLGVINCCMLFSAATGANETASRGRGGGVGTAGGLEGVAPEQPKSWSWLD